MEIYEYPQIIEIQFCNLCNSNCLICPYKDMKYKAEYMSSSLFFKFINELKTLNIKRIIPYLNNEPFIDKNYIDKVKIIRENCPNVEIEISTNASLLTENIMFELLKLNISELRLSVFGYYKKTYNKMMPNLTKNVVFENLHKLSKIFKNANTKISIVMIDNGQIEEIEIQKMKNLATNFNFEFNKWGFLDRAKNVKGQSNNFYNDKVNYCEQLRPLKRMHILANGDVIFCCQDWRHRYIVGNLNKNSILEIWNSEKYNSLRKQLYDKNLLAPELCCNCKLAHIKE